MTHYTPIYVAGHRIMVGSAILHRLQARGDTEIVTATHVEFDLTNQAALLRRQGHEVPPSREGGR